MAQDLEYIIGSGHGLLLLPTDEDDAPLVGRDNPTAARILVSIGGSCLIIPAQRIEGGFVARLTALDELPPRTYRASWEYRLGGTRWHKASGFSDDHLTVTTINEC